MKTDEVYEFYSTMNEDSFNLIYLGQFDDELTSIFLEINDVAKADQGSFKKKVSFLIAECFQNIIRHAEDYNQDQYLSSIPKMFMVRDKGHIHHIVTTNLIHNRQKEELANSIGSLQNLSREELKEIYLNALANNQRTEKGGAGLGLIEMARKSGSAPSFDFQEITSELSNFFMQVNIPEKGFEGPLTDETVAVDSAVEIYQKMQDDGIILVQKGDFSQDSILPLIQLFEGNLDLMASNVIFKKKALYVLIEMLQNITRHSNEIDNRKQGILIVSRREDGEYEISTGNYLSAERAEVLKNNLDEIVDLDKIGLTKKYKEQLMRPSEEGAGAGIGLIEICRNSTERLNYNFYNIEDDLKFFVLNVKL